MRPSKVDSCFVPPRMSHKGCGLSMLASERRVGPSFWGSELWEVWQETRLIVLTAQIAAIYAAILIPFKAGIPIVPGFVELRPANAIPVVASLLFGPPAAWGAGIGNIIGDCFGTLGPASFFGFIGNFCLGYLPYLLWGRIGAFSSLHLLDMKSWRWWVQFGAICLISSGICAGVIAWGVEWLGLLPFGILAPAIFFNNMVMGLVLGPPLLGFLYPRVKRWRLRYQDISSPLHVRNFPGSAAFPRPDLEGMTQTVKIPPLVCEDLSFQYPESSTTVLHHVSLTLEKGEMVLVLGRSGSGKSTLCYSFNGLVPQFVGGQYSGMVRIHGQEVLRYPVWKNADRVGLVFQDFDTQIVGTTVKGELIHPLEYRTYPIEPGEITRRMETALAQVGLEGMGNRDPLTLSGGQRQRLVLASVLIQRPLIVVLDEPVSDLDPGWRAQLRKAINGMCENGLSVLITEHEYGSFGQADRVVVLEDGAIAWEGRPEDLLRQPLVMKAHGLTPNPLTEVFESRTQKPLPISVEEGWLLADDLGMTLEPPDSVMDETVRLGRAFKREPDQTSPVIEVRHVSFQYETEPVLDNVSLAIFEGEFMAILGRNGSGKSTLVRLLNGLLLPTRGEIFVEGLNTVSTAMGELAKRVGLVFQNPDHQIFAETVWDEVAFGLKNLGFPHQEIQERVTAALQAVGLPVRPSHSMDPFALRKGERQRVAVASVLATKPNVLIFDEPTTGLDATEAKQMMTMIRTLNQQGHTIIMITHSMELVAEYAHLCVLLNDGKIVKTATPRSLFSGHKEIQEAGLEIPQVSQFSQRWGHTLLTSEEIKVSRKLKDA